MFEALTKESKPSRPRVWAGEFLQSYLLLPVALAVTIGGGTYFVARSAGEPMPEIGWLTLFAALYFPVMLLFIGLSAKCKPRVVGSALISLTLAAFLTPSVLIGGHGAVILPAIVIFSVPAEILFAIVPILVSWVVFFFPLVLLVRRRPKRPRVHWRVLRRGADDQRRRRGEAKVNPYAAR